MGISMSESQQIRILQLNASKRKAVLNQKPRQAPQMDIRTFPKKEGYIFNKKIKIKQSATLGNPHQCSLGNNSSQNRTVVSEFDVHVEQLKMRKDEGLDKQNKQANSGENMMNVSKAKSQQSGHNIVALQRSRKVKINRR